MNKRFLGLLVLACFVGLGPLLGQSEETVLTILVPRAPQSRAGPHPIKLKVTSQRDPSHSVEIKLTLTVAAYSQFKTDLQPQRMRAGQPGRVTISNLGNIQETFAIQFKDPANELTFVPPQMQVRVPPGASAATEFRAEEKQRRWIGGEQAVRLAHR